MGIAGVEAEVEIISLAHTIMRAFGAKDDDFEIRINDREILSKLPKEIVSLLDKRAKISEVEFEKKLKSLGGNSSELLIEQNDRIKELISKLGEKGIGNVKFDSSIVRGFDYYTGIVFEVFDTNPENRRSLFGGGRYDNLLEIFGVEPVPTVGFGMGDVTIRDFLETHNLPLK
jgi:histidyl-tRNA synthetase